MQAYLKISFTALPQYLDVKDEYLKCMTNGFAVLHVMKTILEIAYFHGLMCDLSTQQLLY